MDRRHRLLVVPAALVLVAAIVSGCSSPPVSQATSAAQPTTEASASTDPGASPPVEPSIPSEPSDGPPVPAGIPDKPADVTFEEVDREPAGQGTEKVTYEITWTAPEGVATSFTVVGVTKCLRDEERFDGKPCLVRGMRIPKGAQEPIKTVGGDERSTTVAWKVGEIGPGPFSAILIRASNDTGDSIFTIAWSDNVCFGCVY